MRYYILVSMALYSWPGFAASPSRVIPDEFYDQFTLNGTIPIQYTYLDDSYAATTPKHYAKQEIDQCIGKIHRKACGHYGVTDTWLYQALEKYPIIGKEVAIVGSATPWYESVVIAYGGYPTTIEYNSIVTDDPRLTILTVDEYISHPKKFDVVLSISSIEHDGLGRYGDPINPNADLEFMKMAKNVLLKESGHMILAVPIGQDVMSWNAHRIYGPIRFPKLIQGWTIQDSFGFTEAEFNGAFGNYGYQPIFYLAP